MKITYSTNKKQKPEFSNLGFGKYFTDHMLVMDYKDGKWQRYRYFLPRLFNRSVHQHTALWARHFSKA